jgi:hypothetical protein
MPYKICPNPCENIAVLITTDAFTSPGKDGIKPLDFHLVQRNFSNVSETRLSPLY